MPETPALPAIASGTVVTVGTFDGVHLGHTAILQALAARAAAEQRPSLLVTFDPHPLAVVNPSAAPRLLTPGAEQRQVLAGHASGPGHVVVVPFTSALAQLGAEDFVRDLLIARYGMRSLVIGYDHGLGRGREGTVASLVALGQRQGFDVEVVGAAHGADGQPVSSTAIRRAVAYGDLTAVRQALGRPYALCGTVVHGDNRGRELGFPTINVDVPPEKLLPPDGVYAGRVWSRHGAHGAMLNLGGRPTFGDARRSIEAHVFDVGGDWYGDSVLVELVARLRDVRRFAGPAALVEQLHQDAKTARAALTQA
jgi:riboflavin kinase/FMN adenylyltransferase